eukprot:7398666-Alexandrium_andersonii.AAC.1
MGEAVLLEHARQQDLPASVTAFDLWKAFGQLSRPVVFGAMLASGWPCQMVCAYARFMTQLEVVSSYGGFVGEARRRPASIPQGCPLSMAII